MKVAPASMDHSSELSAQSANPALFETKGSATADARHGLDCVLISDTLLRRRNRTAAFRRKSLLASDSSREVSGVSALLIVRELCHFRT